MITVISKKVYNLEYNFKYVDDYSDVLDNVLIIDEDLFDKKKIKSLLDENKKLTIIVVANNEKIDVDKQIYFLKLRIDFYVSSKNSNEVINLILYNLEKKYKIIDKINIDFEKKTIICGNEEIKITKKEMLIFEYLLQHRGKICLRNDILLNVLGYHENSDTRIVDVYIKKLRTKVLELDLEIQTKRGKGYILL